MGKQHLNSSLTTAAVFLVPVFSARLWVFVRLQGNPTRFKNYKSPSQFPSSREAFNSPKLRFLHLAREWEEVGKLGSVWQSKNVPAHTGSTEVCLDGDIYWKHSSLFLSQSLSNIPSKNLSCVFSGRSTSKQSDSSTHRSDTSMCPYNWVTNITAANMVGQPLKSPFPVSLCGGQPHVSPHKGGLALACPLP